MMAKRKTARRVPRGSRAVTKAGRPTARRLNKATGSRTTRDSKTAAGSKVVRPSSASGGRGARANTSKRATRPRPARQSVRPPRAGEVLVEKVMPRNLPRRLTTPPPGVTVTEGIDVSHHNGAIAWADVAAAGPRYVFVKATEGVTVTDKRFALNWTEARVAGLLRGAYHYFRPKSSPVDQADHFFRVVGVLDPSDLPPVIDLEERTGWAGTPAARLLLVEQFLARVEALFRRRPIVYTSRSFMNECLGGSTALGGRALWVVDYGKSPPRMPSGWVDWALWQHSELGSVAGVAGPVDVDWFRGDLPALRRFVRGSLLP